MAIATKHPAPTHHPSTASPTTPTQHTPQTVPTPTPRGQPADRLAPLCRNDQPSPYRRHDSAPDPPPEPPSSRNLSPNRPPILNVIAARMMVLAVLALTDRALQPSAIAVGHSQMNTPLCPWTTNRPVVSMIAWTDLRTSSTTSAHGREVCGW